MALAAVLIYITILYVRPGEIIPALESSRLAAITGGVAFFAILAGWVARPRNFLNQPLDAYVAGFFIALILSNPAWGWVAGGPLALVEVLPSVLAYLLVRGAARTPRDLRRIGQALVLLTLFLALNGIWQFRTGFSLGNVTAVETKTLQSLDSPDSAVGDTELTGVTRIRGTGIFNDPNDLAMAFVAALPFLISTILAPRTTFMGRVSASALSIPMLVALYLTNSRGGVLGLAAALMPVLWRSGRWLTKTAVVVGLAVVLVFAAPSRMTDIGPEESSAQGRVQSWSAGLQMLRMRPVLGVGYGRYQEYNELVAHNSFVHTIAELGLIGGFCFTGMFFWLFRGLAATGTQSRTVTSELSRFREQLLMSSVGLLVSMMFLSRQYVPIIFLFLALGAAYRSILQEQGEEVKPAALGDGGRIAGILVLGVVAVYVAVRFLAVWSGR